MKLATPGKVGAFTLVTLAAGWSMIRFFDQGSVAGDGYRVHVLLADAGGVSKRSNVVVAGIPIGYVEDIRLQGDLARVEIRVATDIELYVDATATKTTRNLLGEYFISVSPGTAGRPRLADGAQLKTLGGAATPDELVQQMSRIAQTVDRITAAIETTVASGDAQENMRVTLENLAKITDTLNQSVAENRATIRNILETVEAVTSTGQSDIIGTLENINSITTELRGLVSEGTSPNGRALVEGQTSEGERSGLRAVFDRLDGASESLAGTLENLESTTSRLDRGEGTLGRLTKDEALIDNIEEVSANLNEYVGNLSQFRTIMSLRTDYQFRAQTVKSFLELRLQPREDKYYSIEIVNDPRGLTTIEQTDVTTTNPNEPNQFQEIRSVTTNALRFSLQLAQRFGPFVGRFGIKESTGGVGLDVLLLDDAFELRQDLFGFGEVVQPRWRMSVGYTFLDRLWLISGVDDILTLDRREYFAGMQLKFDDEDLKTVLPFAPSVSP